MKSWWLKFLEPLRWRIAAFLDRFPDTCWAALASWEVYGSEVISLDMGLRQSCTVDPWCGKCWATGRLPVEWGAEVFRPRKYWRIGLKRLLGVGS